MANIDNKYGEVTTEFGNFLPDEPVMVFRARDGNLPMLLDLYLALCARSGSPIHHLALIRESQSRIENWQGENVNEVRVPKSDDYMRRTGRDDI